MLVNHLVENGCSVEGAYYYYSLFPFFSLLLSLSLAFIIPLTKVSLKPLCIRNDFVWFPDGTGSRPELHKMSETGGW